LAIEKEMKITKIIMSNSFTLAKKKKKEQTRESVRACEQQEEEELI
jgi:hypothetical protein